MTTALAATALCLGAVADAALDLGTPVRIAGRFSPDHQARGLWGHPVPCIERTPWSTHRDGVAMERKAAYDVDVLKTRSRTKENNTCGVGAITITDHVAATEPTDFGTAIMTYADIDLNLLNRK